MLTASFLAVVEGALDRWRRYRARVRTRRAVSGLSHHMLKDIGWPDALPDRQRRRTPPGGECAS